jgi:hypothetical protein
VRNFITWVNIVSILCENISLEACTYIYIQWQTELYEYNYTQILCSESVYMTSYTFQHLRTGYMYIYWTIHICSLISRQIERKRKPGLLSLIFKRTEPVSVEKKVWTQDHQLLLFLRQKLISHMYCESIHLTRP